MKNIHLKVGWTIFELIMYNPTLKRLFDLSSACFLTLLLIPLFICISIILILTSSGKIFFIQTRPGLKGRCFQLLKFRTMNDRRDENGHLLA